MINRANVQGGKATLTVVTVCWNALEDLRLTTASVQAQSVRVAHVVVDGGSSDGTPQWLEENKHLFAAAMSERDKGIYDAMNKAVDLCPDDHGWLVFLNAGDVFASPDTVRRLVEQMERNDVDFIFGGVEVRSHDPVRPPRCYAPRVTARAEMPGCHQSCLVRAGVMRKLKFDLAYKVAGDFELWLRATHTHGSKTAFVPDVISTIAPEGYSARNEPVLQREYSLAIGRFLSQRDALAWLVKRKIRMAVIALADIFRPR